MALCMPKDLKKHEHSTTKTDPRGCQQTTIITPWASSQKKGGSCKAPPVGIVGKIKSPPEGISINRFNAMVAHV